jgi:hypothetical protein
LPPRHRGGGNPKSQSDRKKCNACGLRTTRLDLHLIRVHGMERGEELLAVVKGSPVITVETKEMATLDKCLNDFK